MLATQHNYGDGLMTFFWHFTFDIEPNLPIDQLRHGFQYLETFGGFVKLSLKAPMFLQVAQVSPLTGCPDAAAAGPNEQGSGVAKRSHVQFCQDCGPMGCKHMTSCEPMIHEIVIVYEVIVQ